MKAIRLGCRGTQMHTFTIHSRPLPHPPLYSRTLSTTLREDPRPAILEGGLKYVPKLGWGTEALSASARDLGLPGIAHGLFPNGGFDLVKYFVDKTNKQLAIDLAERDLSSQNLRQKISTIIKARLIALAPYVKNGRWSEAMATLAHPPHIPQSLHMLAVLVDEIWYHSGDTSTDFNWYTKRAMLAGVYTSAELYMLSDASEGFRDTWQFVDRRINDVITFSKFKYEVEQASSTIFERLGYLFAK